MSNYDDGYEAINYDAMPAGPEMDDLVAGIMEFTRKPWGTVLVWEGDGKAWAEWNPSVNIAHAWMAVEKMNGDIRTRLTKYQFRSLTIGGVVIKDPDVQLAISHTLGSAQPNWSDAEVRAYMRIFSPHRLPKRLRCKSTTGMKSHPVVTMRAQWNESSSPGVYVTSVNAPQKPLSWSVV